MTKFEEFAKSLEVPGSEGVNWHRFSEVLRGWAEEHRYTHYVPEELLAFWGLTISDDDPNLLNANEL
jgi:hypothetical protein